MGSNVNEKKETQFTNITPAKTHRATFRLVQLIHKKPAAVSHLDDLITETAFIEPVKANFSIYNSVTYFRMGGAYPTSDCCSALLGWNTFRSHFVSSGTQEAIPSWGEAIVTNGCQSCRRIGLDGAIPCTKLQILEAFAFCGKIEGLIPWYYIKK